MSAPRFVSALILVMLALPARALDDGNSFAAEDAQALTAALHDAMATSPAASVALGVLVEDRTFTAASGAACVQPRVDATPSTTYRMASVTKTFVAIAAMRLVEQGRLSLDDEVQKYLPSFPRKPWPITVRMLLAHTSGIGHYRTPHDARFTKPMTVAESLQVFADRELEAEPGSRYLYSSFGYNLLGAIVEKAASAPFREHLRDAVFVPLGMTRTDVEKGMERGPGDAHGYRLTKSGFVVPSEKMDITSRFGGGGMRSTVEDLLRFSRALLNGSLVKPETWRLMTTPTITRDGRMADYGLGFAVYPQRGLVVVAHAGGQWETSTLLFLVPERRLAVALASNLENDQKRLSALSERVVEILVERGRRRGDLAALDPVDDVIADGLNRFFSWGIATRHEPRANADVDAAFATLPALFARERIAPDPEAARVRVREAYHPAFGRVSPLVGGEIASRVEQAYGSKELERLRVEGPIAFFQSYVKLVESGKVPAKRALPPALAADLARLALPGALVPREQLTPAPAPASP